MDYFQILQLNSLSAITGGDGIDSPHPAYRDMLDRWTLNSCLRGGTRTMRSAGQKYLPKNPGESDAAYQTRLGRTFLFPGYGLTIRNLAGKPFMRETVVKPDSPLHLAPWAEDIDLEGTSINSFAARAFDIAIDHGVCHAFTDFPRPPNSGRNRTLAEDRALNIRPYAFLIPPENVIAWRTERFGNVEELVHLRFREIGWESSGRFGSKSVERVRVFDRALPDPRARSAIGRRGQTTYEIWERQMALVAGSNVTALTPSSNWQKVEDGELTLNRIPLQTFYTNRMDFMTAMPPLEDLAWKNIEHWQSSSEQRNILHVARVPILYGAGWSRDDLTKKDEQGKETQTEIGANTITFTSNDKASLQFAEHSGASIGAGRQDLLDVKEEMADIGRRLFANKDRTTYVATEVMARIGDQHSELGVWAAEEEVWLERILDDMSDWSAGPRGAQVAIYKDFAAMTRDAIELGQARTRGDLSRRTYLIEMQRRGLLSEDFVVDDEMKTLGGEGPPMPSGGTPDEKKDQPASGTGRQMMQ